MDTTDYIAQSTQLSFFYTLYCYMFRPLLTAIFRQLVKNYKENKQKNILLLSIVQSQPKATTDKNKIYFLRVRTKGNVYIKKTENTQVYNEIYFK
jgi:hypothetical protein